MDINTVLDEIENIVDSKQQYDKLLLRNQSDAVERQLVEGAACESIYATALQPDNNTGRTTSARKD